MELTQVNKDNIQQIWEEYEKHVKWIRENYYSNVDPLTFNEYIKNLRYSKKQDKWLEDYIVEEEEQCIDLETI